jgi:hypothetical protein
MTPRIELHDTPEPAWLKDVASNSTLGIKEVARIFRVSHPLIYKRIEEGLFPPPDFNHLTYADFYHSCKTLRHKSLWKASTLRKFFRQGGTKCTTTNLAQPHRNECESNT